MTDPTSYTICVRVYWYIEEAHYLFSRVPYLILLVGSRHALCSSVVCCFSASPNPRMIEPPGNFYVDHFSQQNTCGNCSQTVTDIINSLPMRICTNCENNFGLPRCPCQPLPTIQALWDRYKILRCVQHGELRHVPGDFASFMDSPMLQTGYDYFDRNSTIAEPEAEDGWRSYVWASPNSVPIVFIPTHVLPSDFDGLVLASFDDFTVFQMASFAPNTPNMPFLKLHEIQCEERRFGMNKNDVSSRLGRLYVKRIDVCMMSEDRRTPIWLTECSYFVVSMSNIDCGSLVLGPGSSGLQLFDDQFLIGLLTGCVLDEPRMLVFLNVGLIAAAARLRLSLVSSQPSGDVATSIGSLRRALDMEKVELWNAKAAKKFADVAGKKDSPLYRVAFLISMCRSRKYYHANQTAPELVADSSALRIVAQWHKYLKKRDISKLNCKMLPFDVKSAGRVPQDDVTIICDMVLNQPAAKKCNYPAYLFYANFIDSGRTTASGCWLPDNEIGAFAHVRCISESVYEFASDQVMPVDYLWYARSEVAFIDAVSVNCYNEGARSIPTACHHPFLCEISESHEDKQKHSPHSHTCTRISHLVMAPKLVNSRHLTLNIAASEEGVTHLTSAKDRRGIVKKLVQLL